MNTYPSLTYPNMFLLSSGYEKYFHLFSDMCHPMEYTSMFDESFSQSMISIQNECEKEWKLLKKSRKNSRSYNGNNRKDSFVSSNISKKLIF